MVNILTQFAQRKNIESRCNQLPVGVVIAKVFVPR